MGAHSISNAAARRPLCRFLFRSRAEIANHGLDSGEQKRHRVPNDQDRSKEELDDGLPPPVAPVQFSLLCLSVSHLHRHRVVVVGALKHLGHVVEVDAHREVAVAAVVLEAVGAELLRREEGRTENEGERSRGGARQTIFQSRAEREKKRWSKEPFRIAASDPSFLLFFAAMARAARDHEREQTSRSDQSKQRHENEHRKVCRRRKKKKKTTTTSAIRFVSFRRQSVVVVEHSFPVRVRHTTTAHSDPSLSRADALSASRSLHSCKNKRQKHQRKDRKISSLFSLSHHHRHERDVRRVHRLEAKAGRRAVKVCVGDELLDGVEELLEQGSLLESGLEHLCEGKEEGF